MTITTSINTSFKQQMLAGTQVVSTDTFKLALYDSTAVLSALTTNYTTSGECSGSGYTAGGIVLTSPTVFTSGTTVGIDFDDPTFTAVTLPDVRGYMIYNSSRANACVTVFDFGSSTAYTAQNLIIIFTAPSAQGGVIFFQ